MSQKMTEATPRDVPNMIGMNLRGLDFRCAYSAIKINGSARNDWIRIKPAMPIKKPEDTNSEL
jgi:hypothetical protein